LARAVPEVHPDLLDREVGVAGLRGRREEEVDRLEASRLGHWAAWGHRVAFRPGSSWEGLPWR